MSGADVVHRRVQHLVGGFVADPKVGGAATIAGFAFSSMTAAVFPEITAGIAHLREVLGNQTYESFARKGAAMTAAAMATYAYDQIDQARTELNGVSK
jgi:hypothetical protein